MSLFEPAGDRFLRVFCILFKVKESTYFEYGESDVMAKVKGTFDYIKGIRDKKKRRQEDKRLIKDGFKNDKFNRLWV